MGNVNVGNVNVGNVNVGDGPQSPAPRFHHDDRALSSARIVSPVVCPMCDYCGASFKTAPVRQSRCTVISRRLGTDSP